MSTPESKTTFFRQSGWMVLANVACGVFMAAVHPIASAMPKDEYGAFFTLLRVFAVLIIPAAGLQTVFAQQAAAAMDDASRRALAASARAVLCGIFFLWLAVGLGAALWLNPILTAWKIANPMALWMTLLCVLGALWLPVMQGLLQGTQNFLWLGASMFAHGLGRFLGIFVAVWLLQSAAAGGMSAAFLGTAIALAVAARPAWKIISSESSRFEWKPWLRRVTPLTLGAGSALFIANADMLVVQGRFSKEVTPFYGAGAMLGVALLTFTAPLAAVMFPKIVRSVVRAETSSALVLALGATAALGGAGALACTLFPELPLRILFFTKPEFLKSAPLVPWFVWGMVPLTLANVLVGNLLARERFGAVPWLMLVAIGYGVTLTRYAATAGQMEPFAAFRTIVQILGVFSTLLLAVAAVFTFRAEPRR